MGQGSDSVGGDDYDLSHTIAYEQIQAGIWINQRGEEVKLADMTEQELLSALNIANQRAFSHINDIDSEIHDIFHSWFENISRELSYRSTKKLNAASNKVLNSARGNKTQMTCSCGEIYFARNSDLKRGWGKSCSKSCAARNK